MLNELPHAGATRAMPSGFRAARYFLLLWSLFFLICVGLGYPTLKRYDPRDTQGLSDTVKYYAMTTGEDLSSFREVFRRRILVPTVARPFYWLALRLPGTFEPGFFALLMANSIFCATAAYFIVSIGAKIFQDLTIGLLGATLYLLSFAVPNLLLAGLVDAGEACFMAMLIWSLINGRWFLLPLLGIFGALAKETFVPFACVFAIGWWVSEQKGQQRSHREWQHLGWIAAMGILGFATVMLVYWRVAGRFALPWDIASEARAGGSFFRALVRTVTQQNFWYVFGWLLPLGAWRLRLFPRAWIVASTCAAVTAFLLGAFIDAGGSIGRSVFSITGPLLSLSVAALLARTSGRHSSEPADIIR